MLRSIIASILSVVAVVLILLGAIGSWLQDRVFSADGFVAVAEPFATDQGMHERLVGTMTNEIDERLSIPDGLQSIVQSVVGGAAREVVTNPGFEKAWNESLRRSHEMSLQSIEDDPVNGQLKIDIEPVTRLAVNTFAERFGSFFSNTPIVLDVDFDHGRAVAAGQNFANNSSLLIGLGVVSGLIGVGVARWRTIALAGIGLGLLVGGGVMWLVQRGVVDSAATGAADTADFAEYTTQRIGGLVIASATPTLVTVTISGAVVLIVGLVARVAFGSASGRSRRQLH